MQVDLTGIACSVAVFVASVLASLALAFVQTHVKNQAMASLLDTAIGNALGRVQQVNPAQLAGIAALNPTLDPRLAVGVQYVGAHAGEALAYYGITPEKVADKILSRVGLASIATNLAVSASGNPVAAAPLDPVASSLAPSVTSAVPAAPATPPPAPAVAITPPAPAA